MSTDQLPHSQVPQDNPAFPIAEADAVPQYTSGVHTPPFPQAYPYPHREPSSIPLDIDVLMEDQTVPTTRWVHQAPSLQPSISFPHPQTSHYSHSDLYPPRVRVHSDAHPHSYGPHPHTRVPHPAPISDGRDRHVADCIKFDFAPKDPADPDSFHVNLVPDAQHPTKEGIREMDENSKVMVAAAMRSIEAERNNADSGVLTWESVLSALMQNPVLEPGDKVDRADRLVKSSKSWFKVDGSPDPHIVKEVESWFENLVADQDVLGITKIDIGALAGIVAQTGMGMMTSYSSYHRKEHHEKTLADVGVLFLPSRERRYFKIYRIKLTAWSSSVHVAVGHESYNGIVGEYFARNFGPRETVINSLRSDIKQKAAAEAEHLFASKNLA